MREGTIEAVGEAFALVHLLCMFISWCRRYILGASGSRHELRGRDGSAQGGGQSGKR